MQVSASTPSGMVLSRKRSINGVLALRLAEIEGQIASQKRLAAAIRVALRSPEPTPEDLRRIWMIITASKAEHTATIERFLGQVVAGAEVDPRWKDWMLRMSTPDLPDEPTADQLDAWIELSALLADPAFVEQMRRNAEDTVLGLDTNSFQEVQKSILLKAKAAISKGLEPSSPEGQAIADEYISGWARAIGANTEEAFDRLRRKQLEHRPNMKRYWALVSILKGLPGQSDPTAEWLWIGRAASSRFANA